MTSTETQYLNMLDQWLKDLPEVDSRLLFKEPQRTAILSVDVTNAFCKEGNLASPRVAAIIDPIVRLFNLAWQSGIKNIMLLQDCHTPEAEEFSAFAPHAICGTVEAEAVDEIKSLPFYDQMTIMAKNSINPAQATGLIEWLESNNEIHTFIVVGDCTDICVYQLAIHLRTYANARDLDWRVVVPEDCVQTYDLPLETASQIGAVPHPGDLLHKIFLHHMHLNGVEIAKTIK